MTSCVPAHDVGMRRRVLVVDDHPGFRASVRAMLAEGPFEIIAEAVDADEALVALAEHRPDLVLLDVVLPGLDGFVVAELLAADPSPPDIVLVSTRDAVDYGSRLEHAPVRGFIQKGALSVGSLEALLR